MQNPVYMHNILNMICLLVELILKESQLICLHTVASIVNN